MDPTAIQSLTFGFTFLVTEELYVQLWCGHVGYPVHRGTAGASRTWSVFLRLCIPQARKTLLQQQSQDQTPMWHPRPRVRKEVLYYTTFTEHVQPYNQ